MNTDRLIREFEENPTIVIGAVGTLLIGMSKILDAVVNARNSGTYAREIRRRDRIRRKK